MRRALWLLLLCAASASHAQPRTVPAPPQTAFEQHLDRALPLQTMLTDEKGRKVRLGTFFGQRPVVLVFGYYHCPNLCSTVMEGVLQTLAALDLPRSTYRLLGISIDPAETAPMAAAKEAHYRTLLRNADMHLMTGSAQATAQLAAAAGFHYAYDASLGQYVHPSGFLIVTPGGAISRYFMGVRFDQAEVRQALLQASAGGIGALADRLLLLCAHYDPSTGKYSVAVMTVMRLLCLAILATLAGWIALRLRAARLRR